MILMENSTNTANGEKLNEFIYNKFQNNELTNADLVSFIVLCFDLLQLKTVANFAKTYGKTYRGVKKFSKNIVDVQGVKYIIDNF